LQNRPIARAAIIALALALATASPDGAHAQDKPGGAAPSATTPPAAAPPPDAAKQAAPAPPKNLETLAARDAIGVLGKKVRGVAGEDMGMVVDVLVDDSGRPRAAVIDFGGFLGVGSRKIAVDCRLLQIRPGDAGVSVVLTLTRADVQAAPEYKPSSSPGQPVVIVGPPPPATAAPNPG
jgi:hypothetical protein